MLVPRLLLALLFVSLTTAPAAPRQQQRAASAAPAANQEIAGQTPDAPPDEVEPPVKKKDFVPASSLLEAVYLSSREDRHTDKYLDQAKTMLAAPPAADVKAADARGRTALHWARPAMPKHNLTPAQHTRDTDGRVLVLGLR